LRLTIFIFSLCAIISCSTERKYEKFSAVSFTIKQKPDLVYVSPSLKKCLEKKPYCSMVFIHNIIQQRVNSKEDNYYGNYLYSAIKNSLIKNDLIVDGRMLNGEKFSSDIYGNYPFDTLNKYTNDLMIDFIGFKSVKYYSDKAIPDTSKTKQEISLSKTFSFTGQSLEFKITHILTGEVIGDFMFNYTPCKNGCNLKYNNESLDDENQKIDADEHTVIFEELLNKFIAELLKYRVQPTPIVATNLKLSDINLIYHPNNSTITFETGNGLTYELTITNLLGERLFDGPVRDKQLLNLNHLPPATYFLVVKFNGNLIKTERINVIY
jgi:hypothetical protein